MDKDKVEKLRQDVIKLFESAENSGLTKDKTAVVLLSMCTMFVLITTNQEDSVELIQNSVSVGFDMYKKILEEKIRQTD